MSEPTSSLSRLHAGGRKDFIKANHVREKLHHDERKLKQRIHRLCHARGFFGDMIVFIRKRKLLGTLRRHHGRYDSLFLTRMTDDRK
ncbi:MAG TPA: hypothetical protein VLO11_03515 [Luteolibacter sp.]|nr:hypothetical protein [Luteolibacter sp.]